MELFHSTVVVPCLQINVSSVSDRMSDTLAKLGAIVSTGSANEMEAANLKVAMACLGGKLEKDPMILGLALQCYRKLEKEDRGIGTMRGRRSREAEVEQALISDAGLHFALKAGNVQLSKEFGLAVAAVKLNLLDKLEELSLPQPALALFKPEILEKNFRLVDQRFERRPDSRRSGSALLFSE